MHGCQIKRVFFLVDFKPIVNPSDDIPIGFDGSDEDSYDNENEHEIDNDNDNYNDNCNDNEIRDKGEPKDNGNTPAKVDARAKNTQCTSRIEKLASMSKTCSIK